MNPTLLTKVSGTEAVRRLEIKLELDAPVQQVWEAIVVSEKLEQWWTGGSIEACEGGRIVLDDGSEVNGTVKLCYPPYLFEFTWNDEPANAGHPQLVDHHTRSTVRFDLVELGQHRSILNFVQYLPPTEVVGACAGWHQIVGDRLKSFVETGQVHEDPERFAQLQALYEASGLS